MSALIRMTDDTGAKVESNSFYCGIPYCICTCIYVSFSKWNLIAHGELSDVLKSLMENIAENWGNSSKFGSYKNSNIILQKKERN